MNQMDLVTRANRTCVLLPVVLACGLVAIAPAAEDPPLLPVDGDFVAAILVDTRTGVPLAGKNIDLPRQPASMLKMMTELILLERIEEGELAFTDTVTVSARASRMGGSQVYLKQGERFTVEELLAALAIHSANDATAALAEHVAGTIEAFVDLMNYKARDLGMTRTEFHSVHGLPAGRGQSPDVTTARDLAILGRALLQHPKSLEWSSQGSAPFRGGAFTLYNPNHLVGKFRGLDGLKTGYTEQAGYCVTATAVQKDVRLLSVVMGCPTDRGRATETTRLLTYGFNLYRQVPVIAAAGQVAEGTVAVRGGKEPDVGIVYAAALDVAVPRGREGDLDQRREINAPVNAPIGKGDKLGQLVVLLDGYELGRVDLLAATAVEKGSWLQRLFR
ncbi:MAG TPA: D-alanyl-D-alanine carboxypeptidase family protein [Candidatus Krumholzibacteria bacterium]|nr:D-alanyl-D-alanine carboxypeptidase family protein [Candidatus Krumholzibacteria bacterium]HPD71923.1 D-alanyl-D-alanine carboxypeptidase family protein [Candidatus Krumholzibacteria bacterium]HRY41144.1 D-alanyl-D-alanine carboxypeptidase family protein [Candidatus Krumholzibacteria bacterium]